MAAECATRPFGCLSHAMVWASYQTMLVLQQLQQDMICDNSSQPPDKAGEQALHPFSVVLNQLCQLCYET